MKKTMRHIALLLAMLLLLSACDKGTESTPNASQTQTPAGETALSGEIEIIVASYITLPFIGERETELLYDGTAVTSGNSVEPKSGHRFVLLSVELSSRPAGASDVRLRIDGTEYEPSGLTSTIAEYGYDAPSTTQTGGYLMNILYEVSNSDTKKDDELWEIECGGSVASLADSYYQKIPVEDELLQGQYNAEIRHMSAFLSGNYSIESPYVALNPYGTAPLAAWVMFDTDSPAQVSYRIEGKSESTDISAGESGYKTYHELPVIGLYAGTDNTVYLTASYEDGTTVESTVKIQTEEHDAETETSASISGVEKEYSLIYLVDAERTVIDYLGDVRWYTTIGKMAPSTAELFLPNGHFLVSPHTYEAGCRLMEMDFMGKIYWVLENGAGFHHDSTLDPGGNLVSFNRGLTTIVPRTPIILQAINFEDIFENRESLELRTAGTSDWLHPNSVMFSDEDSVVISFRNQHMVMKLNYKTSEPEWILSPSLEYHENLADKFLTPVGDDFEWFYSQHDASVLADLDNNPNTMDILLFDNGDARAITGEEALEGSKRYSRVVQYRIDEVSGTVTQIREIGKELGLEYYAAIHSGAQYLYEEDAILAAIDSDPVKRVVQYSLDGDIQWEARFDWVVYRAYKYGKELLTQGVSPLLSEKGVLTVMENLPRKVEALPEDAAFQYRVSDIKMTGDYLTFAGWGYPTESKIGPKDSAYLYLSNEAGTYSFTLTKSRRTYLWNTNDFKGVLNEDGSLPVEPFGYYDPYLDLTDIPAGTYDIYLAMDTEDGIKSTLLPHKLERAAITSISTMERAVADVDKLIEAGVGNFTLENPNVMLNPYSLAPLAALVQFETDSPSRVSVTVAGKDEYTDITNDYEQLETSHAVPVYGLYPGQANEVSITVTDESGEAKTKTLTIETEPLPAYIPEINVRQAAPSEMAEGLTFLSGATFGLVAVDCNGDVRWCSAMPSSYYVMGSPITVLKNGHLAVLGGDLMSPYYANTIYEADMLGRIYMSAEIPDNSGHHDIVELPNGNLMVLTGNVRNGTIEDTITELDRSTGKPVRYIDMKDILALNDFIAEPAYVDASVNSLAGSAELTDEEKLLQAEAAGRHDWLHANSMFYNEKNNTVTISSRNLNAIITFDLETLDLVWIFADPECRFVRENPHIQDKLLKATDTDMIYAYGQHSARITESGDLLLFDNRHNDSAGSLNLDESGHYSRVALFDIDVEAMTVSTSWQFGAELGNESYSGYISNVEELGEGHYIANFGGIVFLDSGERTHNLGPAISGGGGTEARIYEIKDGEIVFELRVENGAFNNIYRADRMNLND